MVGYFRQTLATIPEAHVFPTPTARAKCVAFHARLRKSMQEGLARRSLAVLEGEGRGVPSNSASIKVPTPKHCKGVAWMGAGRKTKTTRIDVGEAGKFGDGRIHGKDVGGGDWFGEPCLEAPSDGFSSDRPLLSNCGRRSWKAAKASISVKGRQIKYALATRPLSIVKDCARRITYIVPTGADSRSLEQLKRSYEIMQT